MILRAHAKVNLSLQVRSRDASGLHPVRSLVQSIGWSDRVEVARSDDDRFTVDGDLEPDPGNLAWRAVAAVRDVAVSPHSMAVHLEKRIPIAAGLGGGSADAAAGLIAAGDLFRVDRVVLDSLASGLGSDVPFCLIGGSAWMEGHGEQVRPVRLRHDWMLAVAVPRFELATAAVYRRWAELDGPGGRPMAGRHLPPALRDHAPLVNDLLPAALDLRPELGDWMGAVSMAWERPVLLTGSGPAVFAFFADEDEANDACSRVADARATWSGPPVTTGWHRET